MCEQKKAYATLGREHNLLNQGVRELRINKANCPPMGQPGQRMGCIATESKCCLIFSHSDCMGSNKLGSGCGLGLESLTKRLGHLGAGHYLRIHCEAVVFSVIGRRRGSKQITLP